MTPQEFKAWFEGFTEAMEGPPTAAQWDRIQQKVKSLGPSLLPGLGAPGLLPNTVRTTPFYSTSNLAHDPHEKWDMATT